MIVSSEDARAARKTRTTFLVLGKTKGASNCGFCDSLEAFSNTAEKRLVVEIAIAT